MPHPILRYTTRHWLALLVFALFALFAALLFTGVPAWADARPTDVSQTVPPPPLSPTAAAPVATATPGDAGSAGSVILPTPTPKPAELAAVSAQAANLTGVIIAPRVNVRSGPGVEFDSIGRMEVDQTVQVLYRNDANDWWYTCCITTTNASGWVSAQFVRPNFDAAQSAQLIPVLTAGATPGAPAAAAPATPEATPAPPAGDWTGTVASAVRLNLRSEPSAEAEILGKLNPGETVDILYRNNANDWWYVCCVAGTEISGWVSNQFLSSDLDIATAQTALGVFVPGQAALTTPTPALRNPQGAAAYAAAYAAVGTLMDQTAIRQVVADTALAALARAAAAEGAAVPAVGETPEATSTAEPSEEPTEEPTAEVTGEATAEATAEATTEATTEATEEATVEPTAEPTPRPTVRPTVRPTARPTVRPTATVPPTELPATTLELTLSQTPANAAQGEAIGLTFAVTNTGDAPAANVEIRNELAPELALVTGQAQAGGEFAEGTTRQGNAVFTFEWAELAPGESVVASVILSTTADLPDGSVLTNIAAAAAENAPSVTAGVEIGMPPSTAPDFR